MSIPPTFPLWLIAHPGGSTAFRELVRRTDADEATCELGEALSQWLLHFAGRGASHEVREALRAAWWRYIECRATPTAVPSATERMVRSLERGLAQWAAPAVAWIREPRASRASGVAPTDASVRLGTRRTTS